MEQATKNYFQQLSSINVNEHLEKKGQFNYLSWPFAVAQLRMFDETATWEVKRFNGLPYLNTECGVFVEVSVNVRNVVLSQIHPVLDSRNQPILTPTSFEINTAIQRCLVKAISLHGLGLSVYAGEDLPHSENANEQGRPSYQAKPLKVVPTGNPLLTVNQLSYIKKLVDKSKADIPQLLAFFGFESLETIPKSQVNRVIQQLEGKSQEAA